MRRRGAAVDDVAVGQKLDTCISILHQHLVASAGYASLLGNFRRCAAFESALLFRALTCTMTNVRKRLRDKHKQPPREYFRKSQVDGAEPGLSWVEINPTNRPGSTATGTAAYRP